MGTPTRAWAKIPRPLSHSANVGLYMGTALVTVCGGNEKMERCLLIFFFVNLSEARRKKIFTFFFTSFFPPFLIYLIFFDLLYFYVFSPFYCFCYLIFHNSHYF